MGWVAFLLTSVTVVVLVLNWTVTLIGLTCGGWCSNVRAGVASIEEISSASFDGELVDSHASAVSINGSLSISLARGCKVIKDALVFEVSFALVIDRRVMLERFPADGGADIGAGSVSLVLFSDCFGGMMGTGMQRRWVGKR